MRSRSKHGAPAASPSPPKKVLSTAPAATATVLLRRPKASWRTLPPVLGAAVLVLAAAAWRRPPARSDGWLEGPDVHDPLSCSIRTIDGGGGVDAAVLLEQLAAAEEPVLVRNATAAWSAVDAVRWASERSAFLEQHGDLQVSVGRGTFLGERGGRHDAVSKAGPVVWLSCFVRGSGGPDRPGLASVREPVFAMRGAAPGNRQLRGPAGPEDS